MKTTTMSFVDPQDREVMEAIIKATCDYFEISEAQLFSSKGTDATNIRRICFYLVMKNTRMKDRMVAERCKTNRSTVYLAVGIIDTHKTIYQQTRNSIRGIVTLANNFEKKYEWHIQ